MKSLLCFLPVFAIGCAAHWVAIPYTPQKLAVGDPRAEIESIIMSKPGCVSKVAWAESELRVQAICSNAYAEQYVAHFDRVRDISVKQLSSNHDWYLVTLTHTDGAADFFWQPRTLEEAKKLADALNSLATPASTGT